MGSKGQFLMENRLKSTEEKKTLDIHENSKTRRGIHFTVELYLTKDVRTRSGDMQSLNCTLGF